MSEVVPERGESKEDVAPIEPTVPGTENRWVGILALAGLLGWLWVAAGWEYVVVVGSLVFMIFMHELGHFMAARWGGMKATEFFLGFGPRLWSFRRGETEYGIKGIWAGAYVKVIGMNNLDEVDAIDEPRTYRQASYPKRMLVAVAGSGMHFLMALLAIYAVLVSTGLERDESQWAVSGVADDGAALIIGIEEGDRVLAGDGEAFDSFEDMRVFVEEHAGESVTFEVLRDGEVIVVSGTIGVNAETGLGRLGVASNLGDLPRDAVGPVRAIPETFEIFGTLAKDTVISIGQIFSPSGLADFFGRLDDAGDSEEVVAGEEESTASDDEGRILSLVGATRLGAQLTETGLAGLLIFFFSINIFVGIINLAPLLPLDGGHVVIGTYERIRSRNGKRYHADVA
ncbi:MAG: M50 family metallopeptidase, partial [Acidimicrobiales bacterium]